MISKFIIPFTYRIPITKQDDKIVMGVVLVFLLWNSPRYVKTQDRLDAIKNPVKNLSEISIQVLTENIDNIDEQMLISNVHLRTITRPFVSQR